MAGALDVTENQGEQSARGYMAMVAVFGIAGLDHRRPLAPLVLLQGQPSSPLNLGDYECGTWSGFVAIGILVGGIALIPITWRAMNRRS